MTPYGNATLRHADPRWGYDERVLILGRAYRQPGLYRVQYADGSRGYGLQGLLQFDADAAPCDTHDDNL